MINKLCQFLKSRYLRSEPDFAADDYESSDYGRTFGWWVHLDGKCVASLEYRSFLEEPVHLYQVYVLDAAFAEIDQEPEKWANPEVIIQSRYAEGYFKSGLHMVPVGEGVIVVQDLLVPEEYFRQRHAELAILHDQVLVQRHQVQDAEPAESASVAFVATPIVDEDTMQMREMYQFSTEQRQGHVEPHAPAPEIDSGQPPAYLTEPDSGNGEINAGEATGEMEETQAAVEPMILPQAMEGAMPPPIQLPDAEQHVPQEGVPSSSLDSERRGE